MSRPTDDELRKAGASMREIDPSALQADPDGGEVRWFLGDNGTEMFVWARESEEPHHIQLVFARVSVEWSERGLFTGQFPEGSSSSGGRYDTYLITVGSTANLEVCSAAIRLLEGSNIDASLKSVLLKPLQAAVANAQVAR